MRAQTHCWSLGAIIRGDRLERQGVLEATTANGGRERRVKCATAGLLGDLLNGVLKEMRTKDVMSQDIRSPGSRIV